MIDATALEDLKVRQQDAVLALLSEPSIRRASQRCGVSEATLHRWLREDSVFKAIYAAGRRTALEQALSHLQHHASDAVLVLVRLMNNAKVSPASRIIAAKAVLDMGQQWLTTEDMLRRLEALEATHDQKP